VGESRKLSPSQEMKNSCHQERSKWISWLSLIELLSYRKADSKLIIRYIKVCPQGITLHTRWGVPMRHSNSFLIQCCLVDQDSSRAVMHSNLSHGRRAWRVLIDHQWLNFKRHWVVKTKMKTTCKTCNPIIYFDLIRVKRKFMPKVLVHQLG